MKILIVHGPNLNLLNKRDSSVYGKLSLNEINNKIAGEFNEIEFDFFQSNTEGEIIDKIQGAEGTFDALVINPGGFAHTSVAIRDALEIAKLIKVEVHLSNLSSRESFRQNLLTASVCDGYISGFKELGYLSAVYLIIKMLERK